MAIETPLGMRPVTQEAFYAFVGPRDIVSSVVNPLFTVWETRNRTVVGRTYPGWKNPGDEKAYFLVPVAP